MYKYRDASVEIGAKQFHSSTGVAQAQRETEAEFKKKYVNPLTGKINSELIRKRGCPVCNSILDGEVIFNKNGFDHILCRCNMVYVPEILRDEGLNLVYAGEIHEKETHDGFRSEPRRTFICEIYQAGLEQLKKAGYTDGLILDVGCSSGLFLEYALSKGLKGVGIEPSDYAVEYGRARGVDIIKGYFCESAIGNNDYSLISFWDVLEHCDDPKKILIDAFNTMKKDGYLFIQVPNVAALAPRILRERCNMFNGYAHINLFGPDTITKILNEVGFINIQINTVISEISVINNYLQYSDPYFGSSSERVSILNSSIDSDFLSKNLMGYKLQVVARK
jgi:2-polyprenyl-3-methyl-5-hydroxy-6-metoxy-1,4-benzoquinol methylase